MKPVSLERRGTRCASGTTHLKCVGKERPREQEGSWKSGLSAEFWASLKEPERGERGRSRSVETRRRVLLTRRVVRDEPNLDPAVAAACKDKGLVGQGLATFDPAHLVERGNGRHRGRVAVGRRVPLLPLFVDVRRQSV